MATIVFSHGFGVRSDARGLFTDIESAFPDHKFVMFDYNRVFENGDIEVSPLNEQSIKLQSVINRQEGEIILIAHSQGCITAGLIDLRNVNKVILLAPPVVMSMQRVIDKLMNKPSAEINLSGMSRLPRSDGTVTLISKGYIDSIGEIDPIKVYEKIAQTTNMTIIRCTNDEVLGLTNVDTVLGAKHIDINSNHDFTGKQRFELISIIGEEVSKS